jgi:tripartite-type tricarboxylate transporter receptor subunit TctC
VVLTVHPSVSAQSVKELVALIRANSGKYSYASPGVGTPPQLVGALFRLSLDLDLVHVPFTGGGPAIGSTVAGHTPISFGAMAPAVPLVKDGKLRALAVTSKARAAVLPEVPTMAEAGYPDVEGSSWTAVVVPAGTPKEIVAALHRMIAAIVALPDIKERLGALGYEPIGSTPDQCNEFFKTEMAKWSKVIRASGIRAE